jgi:hypothetical protein
MTEALVLAIVNGIFQLAQAGVERTAIISRLQGVPPEDYPGILDALFEESKAARDAAIRDAPQ